MSFSLLHYDPNQDELIMQSRSKKWRRSKSGSGESLTSVEASSPVRETKDLPQLQSQTSPRSGTHQKPLTPSAEIASQYTAHHQPTTAHLPDEKLPSVWNVTEWSKLLWYKYEATFAISMLETVSGLAKRQLHADLFTPLVGKRVVA